MTTPATQTLLNRAGAALERFRRLEQVGSPRDLVGARIELRRCQEELEAARVDAPTVLEVKAALLSKHFPIGAHVVTSDKGVTLPAVGMLAKRAVTTQTATGTRMEIIEDDPADVEAYRQAKAAFDRARASGDQTATVGLYRRLCEAARKIGMPPPRLADDEHNTPAAEAKLARHLGALAAVPKRDRPSDWFSK
jgi:hypothetical protein